MSETRFDFVATTTTKRCVPLPRERDDRYLRSRETSVARHTIHQPNEKESRLKQTIISKSIYFSSVPRERIMEGKDVCLTVSPVTHCSERRHRCLPCQRLTMLPSNVIPNWRSTKNREKQSSQFPQDHHRPLSLSSVPRQSSLPIAHHSDR